jgi:hypothetical protein
MLLRMGAPLALATLLAAAAVADELQSPAQAGAATVEMIETAAASGAGELEAPYQVEAATTALAEPWAERGPDAKRLIVVDLDSVKAPTQADVDRWSTATVLSLYGVMPAHLVEIRKSCQYLCGVDQEQTCHYQAVLEPEQYVEGAELVGVLPGEVEISELQMLTLRPASSLPAWSKDFHEVAWPTDESGRTRIDGWNANTKRLQFSVQAMGEEQSFDEPGCRASSAADLTVMHCQSLAFIAADGVPLLISVPDYNEAAAAPIATFTHDGALHVIVRLGLQAQTVYGLLVKRGDTWVPLFRKAERALMC